jgi:hypothetical protein
VIQNLTMSGEGDWSEVVALDAGRLVLQEGIEHIATHARGKRRAERLDIYQEIRGELKRLQARGLNQHGFPVDIAGCLRNYVMFQEPVGLKGRGVEWGICFPFALWRKDLPAANVTVPEEAFWYIAIWAWEDEKALHVPLDDLPTKPDSWQVVKPDGQSEFGLMTARSAESFPAQADNLAREIGRWMSNQLAEVAATVTELARRAK